jgi:hypothetical protein
VREDERPVLVTADDRVERGANHQMAVDVVDLAFLGARMWRRLRVAIPSGESKTEILDLVHIIPDLRFERSR